jgi:hypothetical protein
MDKIEKLEKRIQEMESFIRLMKMNNDDHNKEVKIWRNLIPDQDGFEENFLKKYSKEAYQEKGLSDDFNVLDFSDAVENQKKNDAVKRLHYWMDFQKKMISIIGRYEYSEGEYWQELRFFVKQFIQYYQDAIVERILKAGKHFEGSGNRPQWNPDNTAQWFDELYPSFSDKKTLVYDEIRKRHNPDDPNKDENGVPNNPSERTIRNQLKESGRI